MLKNKFRNQIEFIVILKPIDSNFTMKSERNINLLASLVWRVRDLANSLKSKEFLLLKFIWSVAFNWELSGRGKLCFSVDVYL